MKTILLYGLTGTGKSTFCKYVTEKYNYKVVQVRRLFESVVGKDKAATVYHELLNKTNSRCAWLDLISKDNISCIENQKIAVIEGLFTVEESKWFKNISDVTIIYLENKNDKVRTMRFCERENLPLESGMVKMGNSDMGRIDAGVPFAKNSADYIIINDNSLEEFYNVIDSLVNKIC